MRLDHLLSKEKERGFEDIFSKENIYDFEKKENFLLKEEVHTFRADIDYCQAEALTKVGLLGIKVWICRGEVYGERDLTPNFTQEKQNGGSNSGRGNRGNRKRNNNR